MKTYVSFSSSPGYQGKYFFNKFFAYYNLDSIYTPKESNLNTIKDDLASARQLHSGISISMPFKKHIIRYLDSVDELVHRYHSCNTILNNNGMLHGFNTDIKGVEFACSNIKQQDSIGIFGNGAMGRMFFNYLTQNKYGNISIFSKNLNWESRHSNFNVIINCTPLGTINQDSPVDQLSSEVELVIDLSVKPNNLTELSKKVNYISGQEFYKHQFIHQFKLYTGIDIDVLLYDRFFLEK